MNEANAAQHQLFMLAPEPYVITDGLGAILDLNLSAEAFIGSQRRALAHKPFQAFLRLEDRPEFRRRLMRMIPGDVVTLDLAIQAYRQGDRHIILSGLKHLTEEGERVYWIFRDITERVQAEEEIRRLNEHLEARVEERTHALNRTIEQLARANAAKDEFVSMVSHELRTPLAVALGNARFMAGHRHQMSEEDFNDSLADIIAAGEKLEHLIENLLTLARAETQKGVEFQPVLIQRAIRQVVEEFRSVWKEQDVRLDIDDDLPPVQAIPPYFDQVVTNLLTNAAKYGIPGAPISVHSMKGHRSIVLCIANQGPPIAEAERKAIFEPFFRSQSNRTKEGIGIGLTVVRRLAEVQGGRIWLSRNPQDGDVEFCVNFRPWQDGGPD
jgi:PAS domain S-box-containing protein